MTEDLPVSTESIESEYYNPQIDERVVSSEVSEPLMNKTTIENFFDTEGILLRIEKTLRGFQKKGDKWIKAGDPITRDEFINMMMNSLRSIINPENMISILSVDQVNDLLMEKNNEFIYACLDEESVGEDEIEYLVNLHDHTMQIFLGHVLQGHGSKVVRQISGNLYYPDNEGVKKKPTFTDLMRS